MLLDLLMYNGEFKSIEHVCVGDVLMGVNSNPVSVLGTKEIEDDTYRITPVKGESFTISDQQKLNLKLSDTGRNKNTDDIVSVSIKEYLDKSKTFKHRAKLHRVPIIFDEKTLPIDPYFLGIVLGDGSLRHGRVNITTPDEEIVKEIYKYADLYNLNIRKETKHNNIASTYHFVSKDGKRGKHYTHYLRETFKELNLMETRSDTKFIPQEYKASSHQQRLELLAGLVDTDGYTQTNTIEYSTKSKQLKDDILFLCRSLGLAAYSSNKIVNGVVYYRVSISGDISEIPLRVERKRGSERKQKKNVLVTGFKTE